MIAESWMTRGTLQAPGLRLTLIAHGPTGPLARTHCPAESTISLALPPSRIRASGTFKKPAAGRISGPLGRLVLLPADHTLDVRSDGEAPRTLLCCALSEERFAEDAGTELRWTARALGDCLDLRSAALSLLLTRLAAEVETPGFASAALIDSLGTALAIEIARFVRVERAIRRGGLAPWQLRRIEARLEDLQGPPPSLSDLAALCGIGRRHLMRAYKASTGSTLAREIEARRLALAKRLLAETGEPVSGIAQRLGFAHTASFSAAFRRGAGMSPLAYRHRCSWS